MLYVCMLYVCWLCIMLYVCCVCDNIMYVVCCIATTTGPKPPILFKLKLKA